MSQRVAKVESLVQQIVATELENVLGKDAAWVTVTGTDVSPDLRHAIVWIGTLGDDARQQSLMKAVEAGASELQRAVNSRMTTKFVPRLEFRADVGGEYAADIDKLLRGLDK